MGNMADTGPPEPLLTRDEILGVAKKLVLDRNCSVKLALAAVQCIRTLKDAIEKPTWLIRF